MEPSNKKIYSNSEGTHRLCQGDLPRSQGAKFLQCKLDVHVLKNVLYLDKAFNQAYIQRGVDDTLDQKGRPKYLYHHFKKQLLIVIS